MGKSNDEGFRSFRGVNKGTQGKPSCAPSDFFTFGKKSGGKEEKTFFCLGCETRLHYPAETKKYYFFQELLCKDCLKLWIERRIILLAVGKIGGVADFQIKFSDLKKYTCAY